MSYIQPQQRRRLAMRSQRRRAMGDDIASSVQEQVNSLLGLSQTNPLAFWNSMNNLMYNPDNQNDASAGCADVANSSPQVQALDTRWYNLAQNWNPTGYYTPANVQTILQAGMQALGAGKVQALLSPFTTSDAQDLINQATSDVDKVVADSARFDAAANAATAAGTAVAAPDLKDWLIQALLTTSNCYMLSAVLQCNATWLDSADQFMTQAEAIAAQIGGIVLAAGQTAINVAEGAFDAASFASKYAMWGILGVGGYFLYKWLK